MAHTQTDTHAPAMQRDPDRLAREAFDVLIVGGGIYGVWTALDAAQRGLRVALVEQNDFGSGTSANSQRVIHGGLRYLQHGNLKRMRESIRERSTLLRVAGRFVVPMRFLVPTYGLGMRGRPAMFTAMVLNDLISGDRNNGLPSIKQIPNGKMLSVEECLKIAPGIEREGLTGAAAFHDAVVHNSERFALAVVRSATEAGAHVANHVRVTGFLRDGKRVTGVEAEDRLTGRTFTIKSTITLSCAGPWTGRTAGMLTPDLSEKPKQFETLRAVALMTRDLFHGKGLAVPSRKAFKDDKELINKGYRNLFVTPCEWNSRSLIGTFYTDYEGDPDKVSVSEDEVRGFIDEFNQSYPAAELSYEDVQFTFMGLLPKAPGQSGAEPVCEKRCRLIDHAKQEGVDGLITVFGVKWTTARGVAEKAVTLAMHKLGGGIRPCATDTTPLYGEYPKDHVQTLCEVLDKNRDWLSKDMIVYLARTYGSEFREVVALAESDPRLREQISDDNPRILAQVAYAARSEMARTLLDVLFHRIDIGFKGYPGVQAVERCATVLAKELGWDADRRRQEVASVRQAYLRRGLAVPDTAPAEP